MIGLSAMGYAYLLSSYLAMKRKSAVPADWERIFTDGREESGGGRVAHGLARIYTDGACVAQLVLIKSGVVLSERVCAVPAD